MNYIKKIFCVILSACLLAGCAATINSSVTSFHSLGATTGFSATIFVEAGDGAKQGPEFDYYAGKVVSCLAKHGFTASNSKETADYLAILSYSIDGGTEFTYSTPIFGQTGGGTTYHTGSVYSGGTYGNYSGSSYTPPTYGVTGSATNSDIVFKRILKLEIIDSKNQKPFWQGRNISSGSKNEIAAVLPTMIEALLKDFPGKTGETKLISLPVK